MIFSIHFTVMALAMQHAKLEVSRLLCQVKYGVPYFTCTVPGRREYSPEEIKLG